MICAPPVDIWGSAGWALGQRAGPLQHHCGLGDMVALFGSKLSVFSRSVLFTQETLYLYQVSLIYRDVFKTC